MAVSKKDPGLVRNPTKRRKVVVRIVAVSALAVFMTLVFLNREQWDTDSIGQWVEAVGPMAWLVFMALYAISTVLFFPGSVLTLAGGALFGPVLGSFVNLTGATIGATLAFLVARYLGAD